MRLLAIHHILHPSRSRYHIILRSADTKKKYSSLQELNGTLAHVVGAAKRVAGHNALTIPALTVVERGAAVGVGAAGAEAHIGRVVVDAYSHGSGGSDIKCSTET